MDTTPSTLGLEAQLNLATESLRAASAQGRIDLAKFALGMIAGATAAALPEADRGMVHRLALEGSEEQDLDRILDIAVYLKSRIAEPLL